MRWENTVRIDAQAQRVWDLTIDVTAWPSFTPTVTKLDRLDDGPMRVGSSARIKQPGQTAAVWTVTSLVPGREFAWQTKRMGVTMTGSHVVEGTASGCRNTLAIELTGPGARPFGLLFGALMRKAIATENAALKTKAQEAVGGRPKA
jgi:Polyketide cyclase / dehydrase and lipid transport